MKRRLDPFNFEHLNGMPTTIHLYLNMQYNQFEGTIHLIIVHHEHIPYRGVIFQFQHVGNLKKKKEQAEHSYLRDALTLTHMKTLSLASF